MNMFNPKQLPVAVECQQDCGFTCELDESTKNFIKDSIKEAIRGKPDYNQLHLELFLLDEEECRPPYLRQYIKFHSRIELYQKSVYRRHQKSDQDCERTDCHPWVDDEQADECFFCGYKPHPSRNGEFEQEAILSANVPNQSSNCLLSRPPNHCAKLTVEPPTDDDDNDAMSDDVDTNSERNTRKLSSSTCDDVVCMKVGYCACLN